MKHVTNFDTNKKYAYEYVTAKLSNEFSIKESKRDSLTVIPSEDWRIYMRSILNDCMQTYKAYKPLSSDVLNSREDINDIFNKHFDVKLLTNLCEGRVFNENGRHVIYPPARGKLFDKLNVISKKPSPMSILTATVALEVLSNSTKIVI